MKKHPNSNPIIPGDSVPWKRGEVRVMAMAEGYAMVRYKGATPFVVRMKELYAFEPEQVKAE